MSKFPFYPLLYMESKLFSHHAMSRRDTGLQKRLTYEDLINYIVKDPDTIRYPDRRAKILRNSFELSQLDGIGMMDINRQYELNLIDHERQLLLRQFAQHYNLPLNEVMTYIDHHGLHPVREDDNIFMGGAQNYPPHGGVGAQRQGPQGLGQGHQHHQAPHHNPRQLLAINGVPIPPAPAPAGQPAPPPQPPPQVATAVDVDVMDLGGVPNPSQIPLLPSRGHRFRGQSNSPPRAPLPRASRSMMGTEPSTYINNLVDPVGGPKLPSNTPLKAGPQLLPESDREPTTPRSLQPAESGILSATEVANRIRGNAIQIPEQLPPPPTARGVVSHFVPRALFYGRRKIRAVAGQGDEAEARADRAQMLSVLDVDLQQVRMLAQREKTAGHARAMLNSAIIQPYTKRIRQGRDESTAPATGIGPIEAPEPAPTIAPLETTARRRYSTKQPRRATEPEREFKPTTTVRRRYLTKQPKRLSEM